MNAPCYKSQPDRMEKHMRLRTLNGILVLLCVAAILTSGTAWALDEAVLTPTSVWILALPVTIAIRLTYLNRGYSDRYAVL